MSKYKFGAKNILDALLYIPVIIPEIILGISLLASFSLAYIPLGRISLVIAHTTFCIPFVVFTVRARLADYDYSMEEAAMDLGANRLQVLTGITLPIIKPGIISGALLAFTLSIDDFIISFFTAGPQSPTFPLKIMENVRSGIRPDIYALSSIIMFITFIIAVISQSARYRRAKKAKKTTC
jgi:spermidine/putrescine transport system permease protein